MALTKIVGDVLPDFLKVLDLGERFLGLGSHTPSHRRQIKARRKKALVPLVRSIVTKVQRSRTPRRAPKRKRPVKSRRTKPMSRKRRRGGSHTVAHMLHGGTGDLKPQYMTISTTGASALDDYTATRIALPVSHFGSIKNKTIIFEILRIEWYLNIIDLADNLSDNIGFLSTTEIRQTGVACSPTTMAEDVANSLVIAPAITSSVLSTNGAFTRTFPICINTTDSAGNGILVATDVIFITHGNNGGGGLSGRATAKILYRLSSVGITEYVGILQGQQ